MIERLGNLLYWLCNIFAALLVIWGVFIGLSGKEQSLGVVAGVIAVAIYGLGRGIRYVLADR